MKPEPTTQDILDAMHTFSSHMDEQIGGIKSDIGGMKVEISGIKTTISGMQSDIGGIKTTISGMQSDIGGIKTTISGIKAVMVTKEYLDDKLADLRGDLVTLVRKEDRKLAAVVDELVKRNLFDESTARRIFELEPFARI